MLSDRTDPLGMLHRGIAAAIRRRRTAARRLLWRAAEAAPSRELAWLWLAKLAETESEHEYALARAILANPTNERTRRTLTALRARRNHSPAAEFRCPLCDLPESREPRTCARCRAVVRLDDVDVFFEPLDVDRKLLLGVVERLTRRGEARSVEDERRLALALLNLGELADALEQLRHTHMRCLFDAPVRRALDGLSRRLDQIEVGSDFETDVIDRPSRGALGLRDAV
ncbi:MAG: hypothetical protein AAGC60_21315 [Acidobacteriota bacterium]